MVLAPRVEGTPPQWSASKTMDAAESTATFTGLPEGLPRAGLRPAPAAAAQREGEHRQRRRRVAPHATASVWRDRATAPYVATVALSAEPLTIAVPDRLVTGRVVGEDGRPIAGAKVILRTQGEHLTLTAGTLRVRRPLRVLRRTRRRSGPPGEGALLSRQRRRQLRAPRRARAPLARSHAGPRHAANGARRRPAQRPGRRRYALRVGSANLKHSPADTWRFSCFQWVASKSCHSQARPWWPPESRARKRSGPVHGVLILTAKRPSALAGERQRRVADRVCSEPKTVSDADDGTGTSAFPAEPTRALLFIVQGRQIGAARIRRSVLPRQSR
jgi:hypothetical protein